MPRIGNQLRTPVRRSRYARSPLLSDQPTKGYDASGQVCDTNIGSCTPVPVDGVGWDVETPQTQNSVPFGFSSRRPDTDEVLHPHGIASELAGQQTVMGCHTQGLVTDQALTKSRPPRRLAQAPWVLASNGEGHCP